jgi:hypothetical protein
LGWHRVSRSGLQKREKRSNKKENKFRKGIGHENRLF